MEADEQPPDLFVETEAPHGQPYLPELDLWLDPRRSKEFAFVSHAHSDHFAPHRLILCSSETRKILRGRFGAKRSEFLDAPLGGFLDLNGFRLRFLSAGHIAGSAQLHVERLSDGATLVDTGDFKLRPGLSSEPTEIRPADTVIMETTFGLPRFRMPPTEEVIASIATFSRETLAAGEIPIFLCYSLGKAQELLMSLHAQAPELAFQLHPSVAKMTKLVATLGYQFPPFTEFDPGKRSPSGHVVIRPPSMGRGKATHRLPNSRVAMVTGWAIDASARYRYRADQAFPLSDHADFDDLLAYVEKTSPKKVITLHGYTREFAAVLRSRGVDAWSISGNDQIELNLGL